MIIRRYIAYLKKPHFQLFFILLFHIFKSKEHMFKKIKALAVCEKTVVKIENMNTNNFRAEILFYNLL